MGAWGRRFQRFLRRISTPLTHGWCPYVTPANILMHFGEDPTYMLAATEMLAKEMQSPGNHLPRRPCWSDWSCTTALWHQDGPWIILQWDSASSNSINVCGINSSCQAAGDKALQRHLQERDVQWRSLEMQHLAWRRQADWLLGMPAPELPVGPN